MYIGPPSNFLAFEKPRLCRLDGNELQGVSLPRQGREAEKPGAYSWRLSRVYRRYADGEPSQRRTPLTERP